MNQCTLEKMNTEECGKMSKTIFYKNFEEERVLAKNARGWKIAGQKNWSPGRNAKGFGRRWKVKCTKEEVEQRRPKKRKVKVEKRCGGSKKCKVLRLK